MTAEEQISQQVQKLHKFKEDLFDKYSEYLQGEGMLWHGYFVCKKSFLLALEEYASQQAKEQWNAAIDEAEYAVNGTLNKKFISELKKKP